MGSAQEARKIIRDILNTNLLDPYPDTRKGTDPKHFYDKSDGLNLTRADTFPKGYLTSEAMSNVPDGWGKSGHNTRAATINIWYFVKDKISYTDINNVKYIEEEYIDYMMNLIEQEILRNRKIGTDYHLQSIGNSEGPKINQEGAIKVYYDVLPVVIYWNEAY